MSFNVAPLYRLAFLSLALLTLSLSACQKGDLDQLEQETALATYNISTIKIVVSESFLPATDIQMPVNQSLQIHLFGVRTDLSEVDITEQTGVTWKTTGVGSISKTGVFSSGASVGAATISAVFAGLTSGDFPINVIDSNKSIEIWVADSETLTDNHTANLSIGLCDQASLKAYYNYGPNPNPNITVDSFWPVNTAVTWSKSADTGSVNTAVNATSGLVTTSEPSAIDFDVNAGDGTLTGTRSFIGNGNAPNSLRIDPGSFTLSINSSKSLNSYALYANVEKLVTQAASWSAAPTTIATANKNTITGIDKGVATISATCGGATATSTATVSNQEVAYIEVIPPNVSDDGYVHLTYIDGSTNQPTVDLSVTAYFTDGGKQTNWTDNITWNANSPDSANVVSVDGDGLVTATGRGTANVTATYTGVSPNIVVTVGFYVQ